MLKNFNLSIEAGQKVGLVGRSGSGKTTITKLIMRNYDLTKGELSIGGHDVRLLGTKNVRSLISYVPQDPALFHRSIKENIIYGHKLNTRKLKAVVKQAYLEDFVKGLENGLDTLVGDRGIKLSGGQRQRVAIARALYRNAPIIIFDEATSALDSESEASIQKALSNLLKKKTAIVVAHRLSTLKNMDRIVVMDKGKILEDGSHKELLAKGGLYAKLWEHQSGGFIDED